MRRYTNESTDGFEMDFKMTDGRVAVLGMSESTNDNYAILDGVWTEDYDAIDEYLGDDLDRMIDQAYDRRQELIKEAEAVDEQDALDNYNTMMYNQRELNAERAGH